jgi:hypothetical protein
VVSQLTVVRRKGGKQPCCEARQLKDFTVRGTDGKVGRVDDFYFDDE